MIEDLLDKIIIQGRQDKIIIIQGRQDKILGNPDNKKKEEQEEKEE